MNCYVSTPQLQKLLTCCPFYLIYLLAKFILCGGVPGAFYSKRNTSFQFICKCFSLNYIRYFFLSSFRIVYFISYVKGMNSILCLGPLFFSFLQFSSF